VLRSALSRGHRDAQDLELEHAELLPAREATGVSADLLIQAEITALLAAFAHRPAEGSR
jgi:hypothetical protein